MRFLQQLDTQGTTVSEEGTEPGVRHRIFCDLRMPSGRPCLLRPGHDVRPAAPPPGRARPRPQTVVDSPTRRGIEGGYVRRAGGGGTRLRRRLFLFKVKSRGALGAVPC
jgi:hypothetical protein